MKFTNDQVSQLLIEKITGTIEPGDDLVIEQMLIDDASVKAEWLKLKEELSRGEALGFSVDTDVNAHWQDVQERMNTRARIFNLPRVAAAAAIIAVSISVFYYSKPVEKLETVAAHFLPDEDRVYLQNANGAIVYADTTGELVFNEIRIQVTPTQLNFSSFAEKEPGEKEAMRKEKGQSSNSTEEKQLNILSVPRTKTYTVNLSDGTEITMNSKTRLRFPFLFTGTTREVYLDGEAYFKVSKDKTHPFIVHAPGNDIRVLGTEFNVNTYDSTITKTSLVEGSVVASNGNSKVDLKPGFEAVALNTSKNFKVEKFDPTEVLSWMKGKYFFHNASLQDLSSLLTRWYKVKVVFQNPAHRKKTFSGEIWKDQPVELFLDNLRLSNNIPLKFKDGIVAFQ